MDSKACQPGYLNSECRNHHFYLLGSLAREQILQKHRRPSLARPLQATGGQSPVPSGLCTLAAHFLKWTPDGFSQRECSGVATDCRRVLLHTGRSQVRRAKSCYELLKKLARMVSNTSAGLQPRCLDRIAGSHELEVLWAASAPIRCPSSSSLCSCILLPTLSGLKLIFLQVLPIDSARHLCDAASAAKASLELAQAGGPHFLAHFFVTAGWSCLAARQKILQSLQSSLR